MFHEMLEMAECELCVALDPDDGFPSLEQKRRDGMNVSNAVICVT
jgi:hypothetical protein